MTHGARHSGLGARGSALGARGSGLGARHPETILAAPVPHPSTLPEPAFREMTAISGRRPRSCEAAQFNRSGRMWARIERPFHEMWSILARRS
ncbi:hypothetical protein DF107_21085 [Burkholderia stagnalis]|nr:hypothetical protein DF149_10755 [Burkholderia stagnalis]RQX98703.1 hypothetical protein DF119_15420 [Burkholderia stagnalis]RQY39119.1 hypothetical protein DF116_14760 [Burkholderia stagnalis]RQY64655.1 hypothetical protein DF109_12850 [Burkholderia stagnalis]RQY78927.1 hypothetical protein DF107_21085 [Burkholderia stagnalis]